MMKKLPLHNALYLYSHVARFRWQLAYTFKFQNSWNPLKCLTSRFTLSFFVLMNRFTLSVILWSIKIINIYIIYNKNKKKTYNKKLWKISPKKKSWFQQLPQKKKSWFQQTHIKQYPILVFISISKISIPNSLTTSSSSTKYAKLMVPKLNSIIFLVSIFPIINF